MGIIFYFALLKLTNSVSVFIDSKVPFYLFPMLLFAPGIAIYFAIQVKRFRGGFYLITGFLLIAVTINSSRTFDSLMINAKSIFLWLATYFPLVVGCIIAFLLKKKFCPHLGYMGAKTIHQESTNLLWMTGKAQHANRPVSLPSQVIRSPVM